MDTILPRIGPKVLREATTRPVEMGQKMTEELPHLAHFLEVEIKEAGKGGGVSKHKKYTLDTTSQHAQHTATAANNYLQEIESAYSKRTSFIWFLRISSIVATTLGFHKLTSHDTSKSLSQDSLSLIPACALTATLFIFIAGIADGILCKALRFGAHDPFTFNVNYIEEGTKYALRLKGVKALGVNGRSIGQALEDACFDFPDHAKMTTFTEAGRKIQEIRGDTLQILKVIQGHFLDTSPFKRPLISQLLTWHAWRHNAVIKTAEEKLSTQ